MKPIEEYFCFVGQRNEALQKYHTHFRNIFDESKGSKEKHQAWAGGYRHHIEQCLAIAATLYKDFDFSFTMDSVVLVLYFHDIEKMFKYYGSFKDDQCSEATEAVFAKKNYYEDYLGRIHDINFTDEELNALKYVHGEGDDYCDTRVMNELAGFCHACDVISARCFHDKKEI